MDEHESKLFDQFAYFCESERPAALEQLEKKKELIRLIHRLRGDNDLKNTEYMFTDPETVALAIHATLVGRWLDKLEKDAELQAMKIVARAREDGRR